MESTKSKWSAKKIALLGLFTALVVILQMMGSLIRLGPFSIQLVGLPIVVGAAMLGIGAGGWLGFVFSLTVLISGDAALYLAVNPLGTFAMLFGKGILCGLAAGGVYALLKKKSETLAAIASAIVCPVVNTGIFILGSLLWFYPTLQEWAQAAGFDNVVGFAILGLAGTNFLIEMGVNIILCPVIMRLIHFGQKGH